MLVVLFLMLFGVAWERWDAQACEEFCLHTAMGWKRDLTGREYHLCLWHLITLQGMEEK